MRSATYALIAVLTTVTASCAPADPSPTTATASPTVTAAPGAARHVFVIVMENHSEAQALAEPYTAQLARTFSALTNYRSVAHPSLPNYLALTSGSTWGIHDDGYHVLPRSDIGGQLTAAGIPWRAYMESMVGNCRQTAGTYAVKHNPFAYYGGACPPQVVDAVHLQGDLERNTPRFVWITPNLCHDGHDCSAAVADQWLSQAVPAVTHSAAWRDGGVLFITWDEGTTPSNQVLTLVISPTLRATNPGAAYSHYALLATVEDLLGLPRLPAVSSMPAIALCC